ncbi:hypothetical protein N1851_015503 [Merluccius polli]|uniref:Uncharacterized protein n=1 Tax=Merluccius polli TaxID=89951 RepID=A0AA47MSZ7_MERPO|nr:hypothetical protein N1851_015503 [Merluccius polli]
MDPAEAERLSEILRTQKAPPVRQEEFQTAMAANMSHLSSQMQDLLGQLARPGVAAPTPTTASAPDRLVPAHRRHLRQHLSQRVHRLLRIHP